MGKLFYEALITAALIHLVQDLPSTEPCRLSCCYMEFHRSSFSSFKRCLHHVHWDAILGIPVGFLVVLLFLTGEEVK